MKLKLFVLALAAALGVSFSAIAADDMAKDQTAAPTAKAKPAKKKVKPHNHAEANKQGAPAPDKAEPSGEAKKPMHDHKMEK